MSRAPLDHGLLGIAGVLATMCMARKRAPRVYTQAHLDVMHEMALREDWNRTVEQRKAVKKAAKLDKEPTP